MSVAAGSLLRDSRVTCDRGAWERLGCHVERDHKMSHIVTLQPAFQARTTLHSHSIMQVNKTTANSQNVTYFQIITLYDTPDRQRRCRHSMVILIGFNTFKFKITLNIDSI